MKTYYDINKGVRGIHFCCHTFSKLFLLQEIRAKLNAKGTQSYYTYSPAMKASFEVAYCPSCGKPTDTEEHADAPT